MNVQVEPLDTHEVRMTIQIDPVEVEQARRDTAREMGKQIRIPGFRPGMAPMAAVIRAVGGEQAFTAEVANTVAEKFYSKALDEAKLEPYGPGQIEDIKLEPFAIVTRVPLEPKVDLKDYKTIRVPYDEVVVEDSEIEDQLGYIREQNAVVTLVERPSEMGDLIEAVVVGKSGDEELFRSQAKRGIIIDTERMGVPGLAEALVGLSAGEHKDTQLSIPDDFDNEALKGKTVDVSIDVERVSSRVLPELNDELAQAASSHSTLEALKDELRTEALAYKTRMADQEYAVKALDAFAEHAAVSYPPAFVNERLGDLLDDHKEDIKNETGMPFDEYLKLQSKTEEQAREELRPEAERRGKRGLIMRELGRIEGLDVNEEEIAAEVETTAMRYGSRQSEVRKILANQDTRGSVRNTLLSNKVLDRMVKIAKGEGADA
jgi:trigger factor